MSLKAIELFTRIDRSIIRMIGDIEFTPIRGIEGKPPSSETWDGYSFSFNGTTYCFRYFPKWSSGRAEIGSDCYKPLQYGQLKMVIACLSRRSKKDAVELFETVGHLFVGHLLWLEYLTEKQLAVLIETVKMEQSRTPVDVRDTGIEDFLTANSTNPDYWIEKLS